MAWSSNRFTIQKSNLDLFALKSLVLLDFIMKQKIVLFWFRQDLRLLDNPGLSYAAKFGNVLPIYILDDQNSGMQKMGGASRFWLHHSLNSLRTSLKGHLSVYQGDPKSVFNDLLNRYEVQGVFWNRCYEPWRIQRDKTLKNYLKSLPIQTRTFNASLLWEPWDIQKKDGKPYTVFSPFYRKGCLKAENPREPLPRVVQLKSVYDPSELGIDSLNLLPNNRWDVQLETHWEIGENAAHNRYQEFIKEGLPNYKEGRNLPATPCVSRLSPYIHFGEISPNYIWHEVQSLGSNKNIDHFCSELGWREFSYSQLYYNPDLPDKNLQSKFDSFPWRKDSKNLRKWQKGITGIPMVDAGMRELWQTGYMHNRSRMIVGSFLVKNLLIHWHHGEQWFWDTLIDADLANNSASWQWTAGCGADAATYFRIFNPVIQGLKLDPEGSYVRKFIPEIASLPNEYLFSPWDAPVEILDKAGIQLGLTYPNPIVDLNQSRDTAQEAFQLLEEVSL